MPKKNTPGCRCCRPECPDTPRILIAQYAASIGVAGVRPPTMSTLYGFHAQQMNNPTRCCIGGVDLVASAVGPTHLPRPLEDYRLIYLAVPGGEPMASTSGSWELFPWIGDNASVLLEWLNLGGRRLVLMADFVVWTYETLNLNEILASLGSSMRFENSFNGPDLGTGGVYSPENNCFYNHDYWPEYGGTAQPSNADVLCPLYDEDDPHELVDGLVGLWAHIGVPVHGGQALAIEPPGSDYSGGSLGCAEGCDCEDKVVAAIEEIWGTEDNPSSVVAIGDMHILTDAYPYGWDNTAFRNQAFIRRLWPGMGDPPDPCNTTPGYDRDPVYECEVDECDGALPEGWSVKSNGEFTPGRYYLPVGSGGGVTCAEEYEGGWYMRRFSPGERPAQTECWWRTAECPPHIQPTGDCEPYCTATTGGNTVGRVEGGVYSPGVFQVEINGYVNQSVEGGVYFSAAQWRGPYVCDGPSTLDLVWPPEGSAQTAWYPPTVTIFPA